MIDRFFDFPAGESLELIDSGIEKRGGRYIFKPRPVTVEGYHYYAIPDDPPLVWVTDLTKYTHTKTAYLAHGNEASVGYAYCTVCLIVQISPFGNSTGKPLVEAKKYYDY